MKGTLLAHRRWRCLYRERITKQMRLNQVDSLILPANLVEMIYQAVSLNLLQLKQSWRKMN